MSKPTKTPALVECVAKEQPRPLSREQLMDIAARQTAAEMDKVNYDKSLEYKNADMTFVRAGSKYGHTSYMRSRRVG
jgi:chromosome segregation and condensation protein ScpB